MQSVCLQGPNAAAAPAAAAGAPNASSIASLIVSSFNATADNTTQVADTPVSQQSTSTSGVSAISPDGWPLVGNWTCAPV